MRRMVVVTVDTVMEIFRDYLKEAQIPKDAQPVQLLVNPYQRGQFALVIESEELPKDAPAAVVDFELKRFYGT